MRAYLTGKVVIDGGSDRLVSGDRLPGRQGRLLLAFLLIEHDRPVPKEELAELLWGDQPPTTWEKALGVLVSKLRAVLSECGLDGARILTNAFGCYQLNLPDGTWLDVDAAAALVESAEAALAEGRFIDAASDARAAADLARRPLLPGEEGTWVDQRRADLAGVLLRALDCLIEAALGTDDPATAVEAATQGIVLEPYRESGYEKLMRAHSAAGNRAEALRVFERCRTLLADELGVDPDPQTQAVYLNILRTPAPATANETAARPPPPTPAPTALALSSLATSSPAPQPRRRHRMVIAGSAAAVLAATFVLWPDSDTAVSVVANSVAVIDPATNALIGDVHVGGAPTSIAVGEGAVWALNADDHTISKIDTSRLTVEKTFAVAGEPTDLAVGGGSVWVGIGVPIATSQAFTALDPVRITRIDPQSSHVIATVRLPQSPGGEVATRRTGQHGIVADARGAWSVDVDGTLWRIEGTRVSAVEVGGGRSVRALELTKRGLWVVADHSVALVDPHSGQVEEVEVPTFALGALATGDDAAWVTDPIAGTLWRVAPGPSPVIRSTPVGVGGWSVAYGAGSVWVANAIDGTVVRVDPVTGEVVTRIRVGGTPNEIAFGADRIWVTVGQGSAAPAVSAANPAKQVTGALPGPSCGPVTYGLDGAPDFLIASDLPLQTGQRDLSFPMTQAIAYVLARHGYRAGQHTVGYQSCDDSTVQAGGWDPAKCVGNANLYAQSERVIGVIGPYSSGCASQQIAILNLAKNGPLAIVSPANSAPGLTTLLPGSSDDPRSYYPSGKRNYARVSTSDNVQAAADAVLARDLGLRRVFIVRDGGSDPWIEMIASSFDRAARKLGVEVVGDETWDPTAHRHQQLVAAVKAAAPDGVFFAGIVFDNAGPVLRQLRSALGSGVPFIAADGFSAIPHLREVAGSAANGMYVSVLGAPNTRLGPTGQQFVHDFAPTQPNRAVPSFTATYAAQATEVLLDAIARSDGTRASVCAELFRTSVTDGILGTFRITEDGNPTRRAVTILRVTGHDDPSPTLLVDHLGTVIDRVLIPSLDLVR